MLIDDGISPHRALHAGMSSATVSQHSAALGARLGLNQASTDSGLIKLALICYHQENAPGLEGTD